MFSIAVAGPGSQVVALGLQADHLIVRADCRAQRAELEARLGVVAAHADVHRGPGGQVADEHVDVEVAVAGDEGVVPITAKPPPSGRAGSYRTDGWRRCL